MSNEFIQKIGAFAVADWKATKIVLPSITIAQAILESNWGKSGLTVKANNLFGIKGKGDAGSIQMTTTEYKGGKPYQTVASFRKYSNWGKSIEDHSNLFKNGVSWNRDIYRPIVGETNLEKALQGLKPYATDPNYIPKVRNLIQKYNLTSFDKQAVGTVANNKPTPNPTPQKSVVHTVKAGDTLSQIAVKYKVKMDTIATANNIKNKNLIYVGQKLTIPK